MPRKFLLSPAKKILNIMAESGMGSILNMILIGWIVYYICVLEENVNQLRMVSLSKINANNILLRKGSSFDHQ
jgi:hypothetical protein